MDDVLGIIAARGGSKRVPRKNIREVDGKPLLAFAIQDATAAETIDRTIVSTEDDEIRSVANEWGGETPFTRPEELAADDATTDDVVLHALDWFEERGMTFSKVCSIPVTTPFREPADIDESINLLRETGAKSAMSIVGYDSPPFSAVDFDDEDNSISPYFKESNLWIESQAQNVPTLYHPNGAVFAATVSGFREHKSFYTDETIGYRMPPERSLDIDVPADLEIAQALESWNDDRDE
jgi:CMP-N,N'-diacetyllegionaminic acid synthase